MSFDLPAAALAGAIEELGTAAEVAANKGDAPVNIFNTLGEQGGCGRPRGLSKLVDCCLLPATWRGSCACKSAPPAAPWSARLRRG